MSDLPTYDLFLLFNLKTDGDQRQKLLDDLSNIVEEDDNGTIVGLYDWGKRPLAYEIDKETEAHYTLLQLQAASHLIADLQEKLRITDGLVRYRVFRLDKDTPEPPSLAIDSASSATPASEE